MAHCVTRRFEFLQDLCCVFAEQRRGQAVADRRVRERDWICDAASCSDRRVLDLHDQAAIATLTVVAGFRNAVDGFPRHDRAGDSIELPG